MFWQFAEVPVERDQESEVITSNTQCLPCAPGSWNTCKFTASCLWYMHLTCMKTNPSLIQAISSLFPFLSIGNRPSLHLIDCREVPEKGGEIKLGKEIHTVGDGPVFSCYACDTVKSYPSHYWSVDGKQSKVDVFKPFICPGGDSAPRNCRTDISNIVADTKQSQCVCADGYYGSETSGCSACEAGHYCREGQRYQCEDHSYQEFTGQSSCKQCASSGDVGLKFSNICGAGRQLKQCLKNDPVSQNQSLGLNCVQCRLCKRHYISSVAGQTDCYMNGLGSNDN